MTQIFMAFLITSLTGTFFAMILALLRPLTKKIFSAGWHYYMWIVVLLIMIFPIRLNLPEREISKVYNAETVKVAENFDKTVPIPEIADTKNEYIIEDVPVNQENLSKMQIIKDYVKSKMLMFSVIWLIITVACFLIKILNYIIFLIKIHQHSEVVSCQEVKEYTNRRIITRRSNLVCSPLVVGVIRPTLLLPATDITTLQLKNILAHEMTHINRNDVLYKWFLCIVKCVHWFNPAIYFIGKQIDTDCEVSCDFEVTKDMDAKETMGYIETILSLLAYNKSKFIGLTTQMSGNKKSLVKRFTMMKNKIVVNKRTKIISLVLAILLCISAFFASGIISGKTELSGNALLNISTDERQGEEFNFLAIGVDNANRADTILIFNYDGSILTGMILPRNTDFSEDNEVITLSDLLGKDNGDQLVIDAVKNTLGIPVHYYAKVNMDAIRDVSDYVGGIEFEVPYNMQYDDPSQDLHINLTEGKQVLTGEQVEHMLRFRDRKHPNGEEVRMMVWHSLINEFINQAVLENKTNDIAELYEIASKNIETNYPYDALVKDYKNFKNIDRNNIVIENIRGKNSVRDGYFVFEINQEESEYLLNVFDMEGPKTNLISVVTYTNDVMGFEISLPEKWKSKYEIIQFDNQVAFYHKDIFLKYGKGAGNLFRITKVSPPTTDNLDNLGMPYDMLYWGKHNAYVWSVPSDVQHPVWQNRDEEDVTLANDYEDMVKDLEFIKTSFRLYIGTELNLN